MPLHAVELLQFLEEQVTRSTSVVNACKNVLQDPEIWLTTNSPWSGVRPYLVITISHHHKFPELSKQADLQNESPR